MLRIRLEMAGLAILKHMHNLSDEVLCERWIENPYCQLFCGEEFFQHALVFDRSSMTRWRQRMGEEKLIALIQESLNVATRTGAAKSRRMRSIRPARRLLEGHCRHHGSTEGRGVPDRRQTHASGQGAFGQTGQETWRRLAPVL